MINEEENMPFDKTPGQFGLPAGYFQKSARSVVNKVEWLEEHKEFPVLESLQAKNSFSVPENYFVAGEQRLELLNYPALHAFKKENSFAVPAAYFEELEVQLLSEAMNGEEAVFQLPPRQTNFKVEDTYFTDNEARLQQALATKKQPARIISLFSARVRLSVAALLALVLGIWIYSLYTAPAEVKDCGTIACVDKQDLLKSKSLESLETDELYDLVNSKELEKKLENTDEQPQKKAPDSLSDEDLDNLPDEI